MTVKHAHQTAIADGSSDVSANEWNADHSITTDLSPDTTDAASLGTTSKEWSDLFLASGGIINWNNGDITLTGGSNSIDLKLGNGGGSFDIQNATSLTPRVSVALTTDNFGRITFGLDSSDNAYFGIGGGSGTRDVFISRVSAGIMQVGTSSTNSAGTLKAAVFNGIGGTVTTSTPVLDLSQTWNSGAVAFTGLKLSITNTASAAGSKLLDVLVGTQTVLNFQPNLAGGSLVLTDTANTKTLTIQPYNSGLSGGAIASTADLLRIQAVAGSINFETAGGTLTVLGTEVGLDFQGTGHVKLVRDEADCLAQRNSTTAQTLRVYNTYTDASNYERLVIDWITNANVCTVKSEAAGTGSWRPLVLHRAGYRSVSADISMSAGDNYIIMNKAATTASVTLMTASAALAGRELYVKNFGSTAIVSGGASANVVPLAGGATAQAIVAGTAGKYAKLYCDGTTWHIMEAN